MSEASVIILICLATTLSKAKNFDSGRRKEGRKIVFTYTDFDFKSCFCIIVMG